jgi:hypothetical protein
MWITLGVAALFAGASIIAWLVVDKRKRAGHYARCGVCQHAAYAHGGAGCTARVELPGGFVRCACAIPYGVTR